MRRDSARQQLEQAAEDDTARHGRQRASRPPWNRCRGRDGTSRGGWPWRPRKHRCSSLNWSRKRRSSTSSAGRLDPRLEASGVLAKDGLFYVIFDNLPHIACLGAELSCSGRGQPRDRAGPGPPPRLRGHRLRLVERPFLRPDRIAAPRPREVHGRGAGVRRRTSATSAAAWLDFPLDRPNKGLEGLTCVHREGQTYLLGLCEGNRCQGGAAGRVPGGGRIHVFQRGAHQWDRVAKIRLPETVLFEDYSGIAVSGDRIAVVSQVSSALWIGNLAPSGWEVTGAGTSYALPRDADGEHPLRHGRGSVMDSTGPGGHGLGQGQTRAGPPVPGQGPVDPHLPYPRLRPALTRPVPGPGSGPGGRSRQPGIAPAMR